MIIELLFLFLFTKALSRVLTIIHNMCHIIVEKLAHRPLPFPHTTMSSLWHLQQQWEKLCIINYLNTICFILSETQSKMLELLNWSFVIYHFWASLMHSIYCCPSFHLPPLSSLFLSSFSKTDRHCNIVPVPHEPLTAMRKLLTSENTLAVSLSLLLSILCHSKTVVKYNLHLQVVT